MHYRHRFHAGNFADVFKHVLLTGLLQALNRKDKPWAYLDTHAGAGAYNLASDDATRTGEWRDGIGRLRLESDTPAIVRAYFEAIGWNESDPALRDLRLYPGSPRIAAHLARPGDRLLCCETVPDIADQLRVHVPAAVIHQRDGYEAHSLWPPTERRGLVLIDPPFEATNEFDRMATLMEQLHARHAATLLAAWYPLKNPHTAQRFVRRAAALGAEETLSCTLDIGAGAAGQMHACGLVVVNPPFGFRDTAHGALAWLAPRLAQGRHAHFSTDRLTAGTSARMAPKSPRQR